MNDSYFKTLMKTITVIIVVSILLISSTSVVNVYAISKPDLVASSFEASITSSVISSGSIICNVNINAVVRNDGNLTSTITPVIIRDLTTNTIIYNKSVGQLDPGEEKKSLALQMSNYKKEFINCSWK